MKKQIIICLSALLTASSCSMLEHDESTGMSKDEVYGYFKNVKGLATYVYSQLPNDFGTFNGALRESATDNAVYVWSDSNVHDFYNHAWGPNNAVDNMWSQCYGAIRSANSFMENYSAEALERFQWNDKYEEDIEKANMYREELRVLRAFFFFELAKRYGDIPLLTRTYNQNEINQVTKTPFDQVIAFICNECDEAAKVLPINQKDFYGETGRVTKGTALALKSRALLYAASPLHNLSNDKAKWEKAATAAYELITKGWYSLPKINKDPLYDANGGNEILNSPQLIFERRNSASNNFEENNLPISYEQGKTGNVPTQNLVDAFQTKDGKDFDWNSGDDPYANRDPRFYRTVLCNGDTWMKQTIESYEGGKDGEGTEGATKTGYYLKKYMNETVSLDPSKPVTKEHHYILFRYAEVLLNYAEAMAEWKGESYTDDKHTMTATAALNQVRNAANMPNITTTGDAFKESVRRERRVELAFEDHRFWDIRRWKIGEQTQKIYRTKITKQSDGSFRYEKVLLEERNWENKMYLYPIPLSEQILNNNLGQNPGW